jgi:putative phosphoesterase
MRRPFLGIISDTHGLLRPEAVTALQGAEFILHGGDIGPPEILDELRKIAPLRIVRGNTDRADWAAKVPLTETFEYRGKWIHAVHNLQTLDIDPAAAKVGMVVSGHTHQPCILRKHGIIYLNPGAAGHRRFDYPVTVARVRVVREQLEAEIIPLKVK